MALMVGVSGVRGVIGETLTPSLALEFAQAYGTFLGGGKLALGRDSRPSGEMFENAAAAGLIAAGCAVTRLGLVMTPTIGRAICDGGFDGGVMITASHNPPQYNGLKFLDSRGLAPDADQAATIAGIRTSGGLKTLQRGFRPVAHDGGATRRHVDAVLAAMEVDLASLRGLRVVLDSINGAGCEGGAALLRALGIEVIHLNGEPTGEFAHMPEPIAENLASLCEAVRQHRAAVGFAQDPDADRLAIVDEHGTYIGEEYTLALATLSVLSRRPGPVAVNLSTSRLVDAIAKRFGVPVHRTAVGEANVARGMMKHGATIGGEGNGGVIDLRICPVRDSLQAMALVLQLMAATGKSIAQLVAELPRFAMVKQKLELDRPRIDAGVAAVARAFADRPLIRVDGTRVEFDDGWVHIRASNTEPIVRIIAEADSEAAASRLIERVRAAAGF